MIKFLEGPHKYFTQDDKELTSVSAKVHKLEPEKDWDAIATKYAKKNGFTKEYWQEKWKAKADNSKVVGTLFHEIRENNLIKNGFDIEGNILNVIPSGSKEGIKWSIPIQKLNDNTVYPELMIYDLDAMVCGQSDKVIIHKGKINIWDYKTDQEIKFKAFSSEWVKPEKLLAPCAHLDNCNGNLYSLKMSMYMYMLWKQNMKYKIGDIVIEHVNLRRDSEGIPLLKDDGTPDVIDIKKIKLPYRKDEVKKILYG